MKNSKILKGLLGSFIFIFFLVAIYCCSISYKSQFITTNLEELAVQDRTKNYQYLSDLDYMTENNWSFNGWDGHVIQKDKNPEGGILNLKVNGETRPYAKGIGLHARGQIVYDISALSQKFPRFIAKLGVDASRGSNGSIWFQISVSNDGNAWTSLTKTDVLTGESEAVSVDLNVEGYKYLKIYVDPNGSNAADHGDIANAKLVTKDYVEGDLPYSRIHKVEYYDEILDEKALEDNYNNNHQIILERELVNKLGFWNIQNSAEINDNFEEVMAWILGENRVLEEVIEVGEISNGTLFIQVLGDLYHTYKNDLKTTNGYVYEKMMIGLAAAYSTDRIISPLSFGFPIANYDYVERFQIMKDLFDQNKLKRVSTNALAGEFVSNEWFKDYHVQLMRMVMQDGTSNGDLIWLNGFTNEKQSVSFYMIGYVSPTYTLDRYYSEENREKYDQQFYLTKYGVPYGLTNGTKVPRYWMVFANGGICWNASRVGQSMYRVNGIPATGAYQVGHELYIQYYQDNNGNGYWTPRYGNWSGAGSTWGGANPYRYIFNWNNKYFADKHISGSKVASSTGYLYLGQANLNRYDQYKESLYYNLLANSYRDEERKLETYNKALEVNELNLDSYDGIITLYKKMSVKEGGRITSTDWYELAKKIINAYNYHPVAMFDLLNVIRPYLEGSERLHIDRLEKETLLNATRATANETIQVDGVRTHANQLLNKAQPDPITFSFDGDKAGKLVKNPMYQLAWGYSLDGGQTFTDYKIDDEITLTKEEIASITDENNIVINFMGLTYTFTIDITTGQLSNLLFANDLENRVVGVELVYEWRNSENEAWTSYRDASPDNTGDKTLYVRRGATGTQLASESVRYTFTADNQPNTRKYIPVSHLSIESVSTQATNQAGAATYAIDGNYNTRYHSAWDGSDTQRYVVIKLDKPRYVSAVEFVPAGGGNGKIYDGTIWGSADGENWEKLSQRTNLTYTNAANTNEEAKENVQSFEIADPIEVQYIKIVADRTNGNWFTARAFNLYQDLTSNERPTAGIGYSTTNPTTGNVIARLVNVSVANYEIISEGGDTHEFTDNGEFTFRFKDKDTDLEGFAKAKVDWIDRTTPTASIDYSTTAPTNDHVIATLKPSEKVKVLNNGYYQIKEDGKVYDKDGVLLEDYTVDEEGVVKDSTGKIIDPFKYEFIGNEEFTFEFEDRAGNKGFATAKVDWIDRETPVATLTYSKNTLTNEDITVEISFNEENVTVINNEGQTSYTFIENGEFIFEFEDRAGNKGTALAKVNWIDKIAPNATIRYSTKEQTKENVIATIVSPEKIFVINNEGQTSYTFTENGEFEFVYRDELGNIGKVLAKVDWIVKESPEEPNPPVDPEKPEEPNPPVNPEKPEEPNPPVDPEKPEEPNPPVNPENPEEPNPPVNPEKPEEPNPPVNPEKPEEPNPSIDPENPSNSNNANHSGNSETINNEPNINTNPNENEENNSVIKSYSISGITIEFDVTGINEAVTLKKSKYTITNALKKKFSPLSEYFELSLQNENLEKISLDAKSVKMKIQLDNSKKFTGIYKVEGNQAEKLDYSFVTENVVEVNTVDLGKYVISYEEKTTTKEEKNTTQEDKTKEESDALLICILIVSTILLGSAGFIIYKKRK